MEEGEIKGKSIYAGENGKSEGVLTWEWVG